MRPELLRANRSAIDEDLPRPAYLLKWAELVDLDGTGDGLDPSIAERLKGAGYLQCDDETGFWRVSDWLWRYIDDAKWLDARGAERGVRPLTEFGFEIRERTDRVDTEMISRDCDPSRSESWQVALDMETDAEYAVREKRAARFGTVVQARQAARLAVEAMPKWELARLDEKQQTITEYGARRRLVRPSGGIYQSPRPIA